MRANGTWAPVVVALVMVLALGVVLSGSAAVSAQNTACYRPVGGASFNCGDGGSFVVGDGATLYVESGGTLDIDDEATVTLAGFLTTTITELTVNGDAAVTGTLDVGGVATVATLAVEGNGDVTGNFEVTDHLLTQAELYLIPPEALVLGDGDIITPTAALMEITAEGEVTVTLATAADGQVLTLVNTSAETINIAEDASLVMANAAALGEGDTLMLVGIGVKWYELSRSNN